MCNSSSNNDSKRGGRRGGRESAVRETGVREINTRPTCGYWRTPPIPPDVNVHGHAQGECNRSVK